MENQRERLQHILEEEKTERPQRQMTMEDFWRLVIQDEYSSVRQPAIEANNFELKPVLINMVQSTSLLVILLKTPMSIWEDS